jgi:hypothetical protein
MLYMQRQHRFGREKGVCVLTRLTHDWRLFGFYDDWRGQEGRGKSS